MTDAVAWHSTIAERFDAGYTRSPGFIERRQVWADLIARYATPGGTVLDAGCGSGIFSAIAAPLSRNVVAFDASAEMLGLARQRFARENLAQVETAQALLGCRTIGARGPFDLILCSSVLEYVDDLDGCLDWFGSLLRPGGTLLVSVPNGDSLYRQLESLAFALTGRPRYRRHVRHIQRPSTFAACLAARGLAAQAQNFYGPAPLFSPALRPLGGARLADTLVVFACQRG